jgi:hypothetical protein
LRSSLSVLGRVKACDRARLGFQVNSYRRPARHDSEERVILCTFPVVVLFLVDTGPARDWG